MALLRYSFPFFCPSLVFWLKLSWIKNHSMKLFNVLLIMSNYENANWLDNAFGNNLFCVYEYSLTTRLGRCIVLWMGWVELMIHIANVFLIITNIGTHARLHYNDSNRHWKGKNWIIYLITVTNQIKEQLKLHKFVALESLLMWKMNLNI